MSRQAKAVSSVSLIASLFARASAPQAGAGFQQLRGLAQSSAKGLEGVPEAQLSTARRVAALVGVFAGGFGSMLGVGGGVLITPVIANTCKAIPQRVISGTSIAAIGATGLSAGTTYLFSGVVDLTTAALIAVPSLMLAPLGAGATARFDSHMLRKFLGIWLYCMAPLIPLKPLIFKYASAKEAVDNDSATVTSATTTTSPSSSITSSAGAAISTQGAASSSSSRTESSSSTESSTSTSSGDSAGTGSGNIFSFRPLNPATDYSLFALGIFSGFMSGLLGIGGGTVVTPMMALATGMPQVQVVGTSLVAMVVPSLAAFAQHAHMGNVDWRMAAGLAAGTIAGGFVGSSVALHAPDGYLEAGFCLGMLLLGHKTLRTARAGAKAAAGGNPAKVAAVVTAAAGKV